MKRRDNLINRMKRTTEEGTGKFSFSDAEDTQYESSPQIPNVPRFRKNNPPAVPRTHIHGGRIAGNVGRQVHRQQTRRSEVPQTRGRGSDTYDREYAYGEPERYTEVFYQDEQGEDRTLQHYAPPTWGDILRDLGYRVLEVSIASAAQEVVYFFMYRRFGPKRGHR